MPAATVPRPVANIQQYQHQAAELARCVDDFDYFMQQYVYILDPQGVGKIKWQHWPCHHVVIDTIQQNKYAIILKARQLGISWLVVSYGLWLALYRYGSRIVVFSKREEEAVGLLTRAKFVFKNLPEFLRIEVEKNNDTAFTFNQDSGLFAYPATEDAGRSEAGTLCILDEWAFHPNAENQFAAIKPIIDGGNAKLVGLSTANGAGNHYHSVWQAAQEGRNNFAPVFLSWRERPDRNDAWYAQQARDYTPNKLKQEYPSTPEEAFQQSGNPYFQSDYLAVRAMFTKPLLFSELPPALRLDARIQVYQTPVVGRRYCTGVDVAEGEPVYGVNADPDATCITVVDAEANEEVLHLHGQWDATRQGVLVDAIARQYPGVVGIERNGIGVAVIKKCEELGTPGLFREVPTLRRLGEQAVLGKHGWHTNISTKPIMMDELREHLRMGYHRVASPMFIQQALVYQDFGGGKSGAPHGFNDDCPMARAIALQMRKYLSQAAVEGPRVIKRGPMIRSRRSA